MDQLMYATTSLYYYATHFIAVLKGFNCRN